MLNISLGKILFVSVCCVIGMLTECYQFSYLLCLKVVLYLKVVDINCLSNKYMHETKFILVLKQC